MTYALINESDLPIVDLCYLVTKMLIHREGPGKMGGDNFI